MIVNENQIVLLPGNEGKDCLGNGTHTDKNGEMVCLCDECDYMLCCFPEYGGEVCENCPEENCMRKILKGIKKKRRMY